MVFGDRKFKKWKKENPSALANLYLQSKGAPAILENLINSETGGECQKQVSEFIIKAHKLGYFSKGTDLP
jgi:hypothetical protein